MSPGDGGVRVVRRTRVDEGRDLEMSDAAVGTSYDAQLLPGVVARPADHAAVDHREAVELGAVAPPDESIRLHPEHDRGVAPVPDTGYALELGRQGGRGLPGSLDRRLAVLQLLEQLRHDRGGRVAHGRIGEHHR